MSLLHEVALTPDVLLRSGYSQPDLFEVCLGMVKPVLLEETVVRDLRDGRWSRQFLNGSINLAPAANEMIKALIAGNRLISAICELTNEPKDPEDAQWSYEAQASHKKSRLDAIIGGKEAYEAMRGDGPWCCAESIHDSTWWKSRTCSVRLNRNSKDYLDKLDLILRSSTLLMFIDPYLDPSELNYAGLHEILARSWRKQSPPLIELHTARRYDEKLKRWPSLQDFESRFADLGNQLRRARLTAEVFVWSDFHDRYLISNLCGISIPNGFDTSSDTNARTTWTRLSSADREDVKREFDPAYGLHNLCLPRFSIGKVDEGAGHLGAN